jgi:hypothetical protein
MTFADLPRGERLFLDANPMVYHFGSYPPLGAGMQAFVPAHREPGIDSLYFDPCSE